MNEDTETQCDCGNPEAQRIFYVCEKCGQWPICADCAHKRTDGGVLCPACYQDAVDKLAAMVGPVTRGVAPY